MYGLVQKAFYLVYAILNTMQLPWGNRTLYTSYITSEPIVLSTSDE
jgi:hypothetical protein